MLFSSPVGNQAGVRRTPHQGTFTLTGEWSEGYIYGAVRQPSGSSAPGTRQGIFDDVWIGVSQPVEFPSRTQSVPLDEYVRALPCQQIRAFRGLANRFRHTVIPQCRQAMRLKLEAIYYKTSSNLNASLDPLEVSINIEGRTETWKVRVWGLPSMKGERARLVKRVWLEDRQRRANGFAYEA